jgi:DUF4097 and DUF4098 domain-containing protein YvlB
MKMANSYLSGSGCALGLALLAALPAAFAADGTIEISNVRGSVSITGGNADRVTLGGSLGAQSKLSIESSNRHLELHVESEGKSGGWLGSRGPQSDTALVLSVPHGVSLKLDLVSADGKFNGIDGKSVEIDNVSGNVVIDAAPRSVDVDSVSGNVALQTAHAGVTEHAHLQTVSGNINVTGTDGRVKLETVSGKITFAAPTVAEFGAESVSGSIEASAAPAKAARFHVETMSGNLHLHLPAAVSARVHAETFSGGLHSDFGTVNKVEFGPGSNLDVRMGEGDARVEAQSFSGNVELRKQ